LKNKISVHTYKIASFTGVFVTPMLPASAQAAEESESTGQQPLRSVSDASYLGMTNTPDRGSSIK